MTIAPVAAHRPLCVDLDGTLCRSDTLFESLLHLLKAQPWVALLLPVWLLAGRAVLKQRIAERALAAGFDVGSLPWNADLAEWLRQSDRKLVLCTGADAAIADAVAAHWGLFESELASDGRTNLTGSRKRAALVERYGERGFDYAGNEALDTHVWSAAAGAVVAQATPALLARAAAAAPVLQSFPAAGGSRLRLWIKALRVHQWVKNLLIFLPLVLAHRWTPDVLIQAGIAFLAFSLCASSVYLLNDLLDLPLDRLHVSKRKRPFAAAQLPLVHGLIASPLLLLAALLLASFSTVQFLLVLDGYYLLTLAYSLQLKRMPTVDVMTLAALYTVRVIAGAAATGLQLSFWLLAFSMFLFLSLGVVKRYAEMDQLKGTAQGKAHGRGYHVDDLPLLRNLGVSSGYGAVMVLALYVNSPESQVLYRNPKYIWMLCPLVLYWVSRVWMKTHRGEMHEDPIVFALKDRISQSVAFLAGCVLLAAA